MSNAIVQYTETSVPIGLIISSPKNARKKFDEDKLNELARSIKQNGQNNPGIVRLMKDGKHYELFAGERRKRALLINKSETMQVRILPANVDDKRARVIAFIDNTEREDLTTYETAAAMAELVTDFQMSGTDIAKETGHNVSYVNRLLKPFSQLHPTVRNAWQDGHKACTIEVLGKLVSGFEGEDQLTAFQNYCEFGTFKKPEGEEDKEDKEEGEGNGEGKRDAGGFRVRPGLVLERYALVWKQLKNVDEKDLTVEWVRALMQFCIGKRATPPSGIELPVKEEKAKGKTVGATKARKSGELVTS